MVHHALHGLDLRGLDYFFVENVGNLVCPAVYDLGEDARVVALSVTEGEDKPLKYPVMFRKTDLVVLTKIDLTPHLDVREDAVEEAVRQVAPRAGFLKVSARTGAGLDGWIAWLATRRVEARERAGSSWGRETHPHHHDHGHVHGREG
jgi:hydrogenase nickel incorporation protein HypB